MLNSKNIEKLHIIRGLTALYVVIYHAKFILWCGGNEYINKFPRKDWEIFDYLTFGIDMLSGAGLEMVLVFFVLSGFFIAYSFDKNNWTVPSFYINRIQRIYPPYIGSALFSLLVIKVIYLINPDIFLLNLPFERNQRLVIANETANLYTLLRGLIFLPNKEYIGMNCVYWSLLYEGIFYLLAPFLILRPKFFLVISIACFILLPVNSLAPVLFWANYGLFFATGIMVYHFLKSQTEEPKKWEFGLLLSITLISLGLTIGFALMKYKTCSSLTALTLSISSIALLTRHKIKDNLFSRTSIQLGHFSYSLYLFHFPVLILIYSLFTILFKNYNLYSRLYWIGIPFCVLISYVFYLLIEKKSLNFIVNKKHSKTHALHKS